MYPLQVYKYILTYLNKLIYPNETNNRVMISGRVYGTCSEANLIRHL
jgi:hypothetical protein